MEYVTPLISEEEIQSRVSAIAAQITNDYAGDELCLVCLLRGAVIFMVDLARKINLSVKFDFMNVSSYGSSDVSSGVVKIIKDLDDSVQGKRVLLVEDIVDTGRTLSRVVEHIKSKKPASVDICTLLDKPSRRVIDVDVKYIGFTIEDKFIVGYGLDYDQRYRNLPHIGILNFN